MISPAFNLFLTTADMHNSQADLASLTWSTASLQAAMGQLSLLFPLTINVHASPYPHSASCSPLSLYLLFLPLFKQVCFLCVHWLCASYILYKVSWRTLSQGYWKIPIFCIGTQSFRLTFLLAHLNWGRGMCRVSACLLRALVPWFLDQTGTFPCRSLANEERETVWPEWQKKKGENRREWKNIKIMFLYFLNRTHVIL